MVYVGSKAKIAKFIIPIIQSYIYKYNINYYIEPFVGGGNIIDKIICKNKFGYDIHDGLISIYRNIQNGWIPPLKIIEKEYNEAKNNLIQEPLKSYIGFNGSFGSKYFGGFARGFKEDKVTPRDIYNERTRNFLKQIPKLKDIHFYTQDFKDIKPVNFSLIYCDPPYFNTTKYNTEKFNHEIFWEWCRNMSREHIVLISEFNAPKDFKFIWRKERTCSLDKNTGGKKNIEKLFIYNKGD